MDHLDLLNRAMSNVHAELSAHADLTQSEEEKKFSRGRVAGFEIAMSLIEVWKQEHLIAKLEKDEESVPLYVSAALKLAQ